ncbi:hypothetical protein NUM3379_18260 [Kineococcus sp. NUM-3379]
MSRRPTPPRTPAPTAVPGRPAPPPGAGTGGAEGPTAAGRPGRRPAADGRAPAQAGGGTRAARRAGVQDPAPPRPAGGSAQRRRAERAAGVGEAAPRSRRGLGRVAVARGTVPVAARRTPRPRGRGLRGLGRRGRLLAAVLVLVVLGTAGAWAALTSPGLTVRQVRVTGVQRVAAADVTALAERRRGEQLARVDTGLLEREVRALPLVAEVDVRRQWPSTLVVEVSERQPVAAVPLGEGRYRVVDAEGTALLESQTVPPEVPLVEADVDSAGRPALQAVLAVLIGLPTDLRAQVESSGATSPDSVVLHLGGGTVVHWGSAERGARKAEVLSALLAEPAVRGAERLDVSAPDHPAVTPGEGGDAGEGEGEGEDAGEGTRTPAQDGAGTGERPAPGAGNEAAER